MNTTFVEKLADIEKGNVAVTDSEYRAIKRVAINEAEDIRGEALEQFKDKCSDFEKVDALLWKYNDALNDIEEQLDETKGLLKRIKMEKYFKWLESNRDEILEQSALPLLKNISEWDKNLRYLGVDNETIISIRYGN